MNTKINHIYIGNVDRLPQWTGISTEEDVEGGELDSLTCTRLLER